MTDIEDSPPLENAETKEAYPKLSQKKRSSIVLNNHEYQKIFMCGPTCARVIQKSAADYQLAIGKISEDQNKLAKQLLPSQLDIAKETFSGDPLPNESQAPAWKYIADKDVPSYKEYGMKENCLPQDLALYLGMEGATYNENLTLNQLKDLLNDGPVLALWSPPMPDRHGWEAFSHYTIVSRYRETKDEAGNIKGMFLVIDTSTEERLYDPTGSAVSKVTDDTTPDWTLENHYWVDAQTFSANWHDEYGKGVGIAIDLENIKLPGV